MHGRSYPNGQDPGFQEKKNVDPRRRCCHSQSLGSSELKSRRYLEIHKTPD